MAKIVFEKVESKDLRKGACDSCGKRVKRWNKAFQTVNPFNLNNAGKPKSRSEIEAELRIELSEKAELRLLCTLCESDSKAAP